MVMIDDTASDRLLRASVAKAIDPARMPTRALTDPKKTLVIIPIIDVLKIPLSRFSPVFYAIL